MRHTMPPKKEEKKPLTKAQKERLKREEEERKRQEEEEARIRAEQEERERRKREKEEEEQRKKQEKDELKKRVEELDELRQMLTEHREKLKQINETRRKQERWNRYMRCDGSPDPTILQEINTYMNLWREDESRVLVKDVLKDSELCLSLIEELDYRIEDMPEDEEKSEVKVAQYKQTMRELMNLLLEKLDRCSHEMLQRASQLRDSETSNLQQTWKNEFIRLCLWGNLSFNPRIKSFEFAEEEVSFDIPRLLQLSECAYRILFTAFDFYSPMAKSHEPRRVLNVEEIVIEPPMEEEQKEETAEKPEETEAVEKEPTMDLLAALNHAEGGEEEQKEEVVVEEEIDPPPEDRVPTPILPEYEDYDGDVDMLDQREFQSLGGTMTFDLLGLPPQAKNAGGWTMHQILRPAKVSQFRYEADEFQKPQDPNVAADESAAHAEDADRLKSKSVVHAEKDKKDEKPPINVTIKIPRTVTFCDQPQIACWDAKEKEWRTTGILLKEYKEEERLLHIQTRVFGTMALFQEVHINMPFQGWELRPYHTDNDFEMVTIDLSPPEQDLEVPPRPSGTSTRRQSAASTSSQAKSTITAMKTGASGTQLGTTGTHETHEEAPPRSPTGIEGGDDVAATNTNNSNLTPDAPMEDLRATGGTATPKPGFRSSNFLDVTGASRIGASVNNDVKEPVIVRRLAYPNHCLLTIIAAVNEVKIEVRGKQVSIVEDPDKPELNHLAGKWFSVRTLRQKMIQAGVNIFPNEDSGKYVSITKKNPIAESRLYEQMALLSPSVAFSWSRWNATCGQANRVIFQACEHLNGKKNVDEEKWRLFSATRKKVEKLKMTEYTQEFSEELDTNFSFHADMFHMYQEMGSEEGVKRVQQVDCEYMDTVRELLSITKCLIFS